MPARTTNRKDAGGGTKSAKGALPELGEDQRRLVEDTLLDGGTIEDAIEVVRANGGPEIAPAEVARFFCSRADLQSGRVNRMIKAVEELKAGAKDPDSVEAMLMNAAIMAGLQRIDRKTARMTPRQAMTARMQQEMVRLKEEALELRTAKQRKEELLMTHRTEYEIHRTMLLREQIRQLKRMLDRDGGDLGPGLMAKIHQIYGLAELPDTPAETGDPGSSSEL
jgi:hypothetical protein